MSKANYMKDGDMILDGKDGIIIRKHIHGIFGGCVLETAALVESDTTLAPAYTAAAFPCGIPVISKTVAGETTYRALPPLDITAQGSTTYKFDLPSGWAYAGIVEATVKVESPAPVMVSGVVNETAMLDSLKEMFPSAMETPTALDLSGLKSACPHLIFESDVKIA